jgi:hypothetical protein
MVDVVCEVFETVVEIAGARPTCTKTIFLPGSELSVNDGVLLNARQIAPDMSLRSLMRTAAGSPVTESLTFTTRCAVLNEPSEI